MKITCQVFLSVVMLVVFIFISTISSQLAARTLPKDKSQSIEPNHIINEKLISSNNASSNVQSNFNEPDQILEIGVLPYISIEGLIKAYKPLADHLQNALSREVLIVSAKDYAHFLELTEKKTYDLIITASHFARLAQLEGTYIPLLKPLTTYHEVVVTRKDSLIKHIADLNGKQIAVPNLLAQTTILGRQLLKRYNLDPDNDVTLIDALNHKNAIYHVLNGEVDAAIISTGGYRHSSDDVKKEIVIIQPKDGYLENRPVAIPLIYMVSNDLSQNLRNKIVNIIDDFANHTEKGKDWIINKRRYKGLRAPTEKEMELLDPHVEELQNVLRMLD